MSNYDRLVSNYITDSLIESFETLHSNPPPFRFGPVRVHDEIHVEDRPRAVAVRTLPTSLEMSSEDLRAAMGEGYDLVAERLTQTFGCPHGVLDSLRCEHCTLLRMWFGG